MWCVDVCNVIKVEQDGYLLCDGRLKDNQPFQNGLTSDVYEDF